MADRVPEELQGMSAADRAAWLTMERVYQAALTYDGPDATARTLIPFRELVPDAQAAVTSMLAPVVQAVYALAQNPEARRG